MSWITAIECVKVGDTFRRVLLHDLHHWLKHYHPSEQHIDVGIPASRPYLLLILWAGIGTVQTQNWLSIRPRILLILQISGHQNFTILMTGGISSSLQLLMETILRQSKRCIVLTTAPPSTIGCLCSSLLVRIRGRVITVTKPCSIPYALLSISEPFCSRPVV